MESQEESRGRANTYSPFSDAARSEQLRKGLGEKRSSANSKAPQSSSSLALSWKRSVLTMAVDRKSALLLLSESKRAKLQMLASFLPRYVLNRLSDDIQGDEAATGMGYSSHHLSGSALAMFDLCSFTSLAEGLRTGTLLLRTSSSLGDGDLVEGDPLLGAGSAISARLLRMHATEEAQAGWGAEQLKNILFTFFHELMGTITRHGGDVLRLAGDALIVLFENLHADGGAGADGPGALLHRAAMISMLAMRSLDGKSIMGCKMHLHAALGVGEMDMYIVGEKERGFQYVFMGEPFRELDSALDDGKAGQMVVSSKYWGLMVEEMERDADIYAPCAWDAQVLPSGNFLMDSQASSVTQRTWLTSNGGNLYSSADSSCLQRLSAKGAILEPIVRRFVPSPVVYNCEAEASGWLAEIQRVAVIFVNVKISATAANLETMQQVFISLQTAMHDYQGFIKEFSVDDKGTVMVGAMGMPPMTGGNPAARCCMAAMRMGELLERIGITCDIGISIGQVFTASIGSSRREFGMFGDVVNTAARLMSLGMKNDQVKARIQNAIENLNLVGRAGGIVVDAGVHADACSLIDFEPLGSHKVKGKQYEVVVFAPLRHADASIQHSILQSCSVIGHTVLMERVTSRVCRLESGFGGGILALQGMTGIGKTALLQECVKKWKGENFCIFGLRKDSSTAGHVHNVAAVPFFAWVDVLRDLLLNFKEALILPSTAEEEGALSRCPSAANFVPIPRSKEQLGSPHSSIGGESVNSDYSDDDSGASKPGSPKLGQTAGSSPAAEADHREHPAGNPDGELLNNISTEQGLEINSMAKRLSAQVKVLQSMGTSELGDFPNSKRAIADDIAVNSTTAEGGMAMLIPVVKPAIVTVEEQSQSAPELTSGAIKLPWWSGAFSTEDDSEHPDTPQARGEYIWRFCSEFIPQKYTEAAYLLSSILQASLPKRGVRGASTTSLDKVEAEMGHFLDGALPPINNGHESDESDDQSMPTKKFADSEQFDILLSLLALPSAEGHSTRHGAVVVLDDNTSLDRQSSDLVKACLKYLSERVLIILSSPPFEFETVGAENSASIAMPTLAAPQAAPAVRRGSRQQQVYPQPPHRASKRRSVEQIVHLRIGAAAFMESAGVADRSQLAYRESVHKRDSNHLGVSIADLLRSVASSTNQPELVTTVRVGGLSLAEMCALCCRRLGCTELDKSAACAMYLRTWGVPLYIISYCSLMQDKNVGSSVTLSSRSDEGSESSPVKTLWRMNERLNVYRILQSNVPTLVESRVLEFLSILTAQQMFLLKVLAAIGTHNIPVSLVVEIYPLPVKGRIEADIETLVSYTLIAWDRPLTSPDDVAAGSVHFKDMVLHQVAYGKLSHTHRRQLHAHLSEWYHAKQKSFSASAAERKDDVHEIDPTQTFLPFMVQHLTLAQQEQRAMIHAHMIGVQQLEKWALAYFRDWLQVTHSSDLDDEFIREARSSKGLMWLCPSLTGVLRTILAIRSGQSVSSATSIFRNKLRIAREENVAERRPSISKARRRSSIGNDKDSNGSLPKPRRRSSVRSSEGITGMKEAPQIRSSVGSNSGVSSEGNQGGRNSMTKSVIVSSTSLPLLPNATEANESFNLQDASETTGVKQEENEKNKLLPSGQPAAQPGNRRASADALSRFPTHMIPASRATRKCPRVLHSKKTHKPLDDRLSEEQQSRIYQLRDIYG